MGGISRSGVGGGGETTLPSAARVLSEERLSERERETSMRTVTRSPPPPPEEGGKEEKEKQDRKIDGESGGKSEGNGLQVMQARGRGESVLCVPVSGVPYDLNRA